MQKHEFADGLNCEILCKDLMEFYSVWIELIDAIVNFNQIIQNNQSHFSSLLSLVFNAKKHDDFNQFKLSLISAKQQIEKRKSLFSSHTQFVAFPEFENYKYVCDACVFLRHLEKFFDSLFR